MKIIIRHDDFKNELLERLGAMYDWKEKIELKNCICFNVPSNRFNVYTESLGQGELTLIEIERK
jgi:hypothetical protein